MTVSDCEQWIVSEGLLCIKLREYTFPILCTTTAIKVWLMTQ